MLSIKKLTAAAMALICAVGVTACEDSAPAGSSTIPSGTTPTEITTTPKVTATMSEENKEAIAEIDLQVEKLANPTVKFLSEWDLNPVEGTAVPVALEMFQTKYGGNIEHIYVGWDDRYEKLATLVQSGDSPDMFSAGDLDVFPKGAINKMFEPMDEYVDFESELWAPMKNVNDQFVYDGKHYVGAYSTNTACVMIYNKRVIEENNLPDPATLAKEGNWTWDTFWDMMMTFCDRDKGQFATDGWWFEGAFSQTCGLPYIGMEDGQVVHNLDEQLIERVQTFMYDMKKNDLPYPKSENNWEINPANIAAGKTLFYPCGIWALEEPDLSHFGTMDEIMFAPMPRCPDADAYYLPSVIDGFAICKGATNPEGVGAYLNCAMACRESEVAKEIDREQHRTEYGWTDEMFEMLDFTRELTEQHPVIEFYNAVSDPLYEYVNNPMKEGYNNGVSWTQTKEMIRGMVQGELDKANKKLEE